MRSADRRVRGGVVVSSGAIGLLVLLISTGTTFVIRRGPVRTGAVQPVAFNHRLHVEGQGIECSNCHVSYQTSFESGLPTINACALCHAETHGDSPKEAAFQKMVEAKTPLPWVSLFRQPAHVFFSHRRHVVVAGLDCTECHGAIGRSETPPPFRSPLRMQDCVECHRARKVSSDCTACHR